jgi:hypothetical protein
MSGEPAVGEGLDDHTHSRSVGRSERRTGGAFEQVRHRLHRQSAAEV